MREVQVRMDRQTTSSWPFPAYEVIDNVESVDIGFGRDSERDQFTPGIANIDVEVDRDNQTFITDYDESTDYVNGFSRACVDYLSASEQTLTIFPDALMTLQEPSGVGRVELYQQRLTTKLNWRLGSDIEYYAPVEAYEKYVIGLSLQELTGITGDYPLKIVIYWFTESGGFLSSETVFQGNVTTPNVKSRKYGIVSAPYGAAYASIGSTVWVSITTSEPTMRFSEFMIHKYDQAFETANGGVAFKPFAVDDLFSKAPEASTPVQVVVPGNQYNIKNYPQSTIGSDATLRSLVDINLASPVYSMDVLTSGTIAKFFAMNRITRTVINTDFHDGTQCIRAQTDTAGSGTHTLYFAGGSTSYNIPVEPGITYRFSVWVKNKSASTATINFLVKDQKTLSSNLAIGQVVPGSSSWLKYQGTWTVPSNINSCLAYMTFAAANYDLYIDQLEVRAISGTEHDSTYNYYERFGDFEKVDTPFISSQMTKAATTVIQQNYDVTANSPEKPRILRVVKPTGVTSSDFYFGPNSATSNLWTEPGRNYTLTFWARKMTGSTAQILVYSRSNNEVLSDPYTLRQSHTLTSDWQQFSTSFVVPANSSATSIALVLQGLSGESVEMQLDALYFTRFQEKGVSHVIDGLTRTSVYQFESKTNNRNFSIAYGNDSIDDLAVMTRWYHSGKTRTRYKATIKSIGKDLPVGTTASVIWVGTNGRNIRRPDQAYKGKVIYHLAESISLPTGGGEITVSSLAPDIPWRSWAPTISFTVPSDAATTFGYEFRNEFIGPDGYENSPEQSESVRFTGKVARRTDKYEDMSINDKRKYMVGFECLDMLGVLVRGTIQTPMQSVVLRDKPTAYMPLGDETLSELGGRLTDPPQMLTAGTPNNWGASFDSEVTLAGLKENEGGSYSFTYAGNSFAGQLIKLKDTEIAASPGRGFSMGAWFSHTAPINSGIETVFSQVDEKTNFVTGAYFSLTSTGIKAGIYQDNSIDMFINLNTDGKAHYGVVTSDGETVNVYLDGYRIGGHSLFKQVFTATYIGGEYRSGLFRNMFNGHIGHVEIYDYALTAEQVEDHWKSGKGLRKGDTELERIEHILDLASQPGIPPIVRTRDGNIPETVTTLTTPSWGENSDPTGLLNEISKWTGGQIFAGPNGAMIYENRYQRFNNGGEDNQSWHIGKDQQIQPETDQGLQASPDITKLINEAVISSRYVDADEGGVQSAIDRKSIARYGKYTYKETYDLEKPEDAKYIAQWIVATNSKTYPRYEQLVFEATANEATANLCQMIRISDHVYGDLSVSNGLDAGSVSGFVENIQESVRREGKTLRWTTTIELSPAQNQLVWIIEDPVYGQIDSGYSVSY